MVGELADLIPIQGLPLAVRRGRFGGHDDDMVRQAGDALCDGEIDEVVDKAEKGEDGRHDGQCHPEGLVEGHVNVRVPVGDLGADLLERGLRRVRAALRLAGKGGYG